jgi:DNA-binding CsgD family transcriptional regulator
VPGLTARERDVLELVAEGLSNTEIADRLRIGVTTVKTHITSLMTKTGSPTRVRLARHALGAGRSSRPGAFDRAVRTRARRRPGARGGGFPASLIPSYRAEAVLSAPSARSQP